MRVRKEIQVLLRAFVAVLILGGQSVSTLSEDGISRPVQGARLIVIREVSHHRTPPMRNLKTSLPLPDQTADRDSINELGDLFSPPVSLLTTDSAVSNSVVHGLVTTPGLNFEGIDAPSSGPVNPLPDPNGAVGSTQYVQVVNTYYAVFDKSSGALLLGPRPLVSLWSGTGTPCATSGQGDPIVEYDKLAGRWVISHHAAIGSTPGASGYQGYECIAVSSTSDATGSYVAYCFPVSSYWPDYPKMGFWPDAYYFSYDLLGGSQWGFVGAMACAYDRNAMLQGKTATSVCFQLPSTSGNRLLPADLELCPPCTAGSILPNPGEPDFFMNLASSFTGLNLYKFHVDFQNPQNSTFTGPTLVGTARYTPACLTGYHLCIPQLGTANFLDVSGGAGLPPVGLMHRLSYRRIPGGPEVLLAVHSIAPNAQIRWYEIRNPNVVPWVYQQGTFSPDSNFRWNASIAMDQAGDIAVGYAVSGPSMYPAIRYTGRVPSDPPDTLETEASIMEGSGSETAGHGWGDYSSMSIDPEDDCTFWYTGEYLKTSGGSNWSTRIASFKFPSCP